LSKLPEDFDRDTQKTALALKQRLRRLETRSVLGLEYEQDPKNAGSVKTTNQELRKHCCGNNEVANHLLEVSQPWIEMDNAEWYASTTAKTREFVKLLRRHRIAMDKACESYEKSLGEDADNLNSTMSALEDGILASLQDLQMHRIHGVDSLAPPHHKRNERSIVQGLGNTLRIAGLPAAKYAPPSGYWDAQPIKDLEVTQAAAIEDQSQTIQYGTLALEPGTLALEGPVIQSEPGTEALALTQGEGTEELALVLVEGAQAAAVTTTDDLAAGTSFGDTFIATAGKFEVDQRPSADPGSPPPPQRRGPGVGHRGAGLDK
jgi:hypothetical protein